MVLTCYVLLIWFSYSPTLAAPEASVILPDYSICIRTAATVLSDIRLLDQSYPEARCLPEWGYWAKEPDMAFEWLEYPSPEIPAMEVYP